MFLSVAVLGVLGAAPAGGADPAALAGPIKITGSDGKDDLVVTFDTDSGELRMTVTPAAAVTASSGSCPPQMDPLTGRPTANVCDVASSASLSLAVDLKAGDDMIFVVDRIPTTVSGGPGNDMIFVDGDERTLKGDDGDDLLSAPGFISSTQANNEPVSYDGGPGADTASFAGAEINPDGNPRAVGVTASLETKTATFQGPGPSTPLTVYRVDTLNGIERLAGTGVGDVLTGSTKADTLIGETGNDDIRGGDGDDDIQGGGGLDDLGGGPGKDIIDGGSGIDIFPKGSGGDTFLARDGYAESIPCFSQDTIMDDLVDRVNGDATKCSISTAAAKHRFDTKLSGRPAKLGNGLLRIRVRCPARKSTTCEGELEAKLGKRTLGVTSYELRSGSAGVARIPLSAADERRAAGRTILLSASEIDADGRGRFVSRPTRAQLG